jgi:hypothetical protein
VGDELLSLGRQDKSFSLKDLRNINSSIAGWTEMKAAVTDPTAETFLNLSGFKVSRAIDASGFEGADIVHGLNCAIPEHLQDVTSFFYDGGTLEHVFDVATSFKNAFDLLSFGGIALFALSANNLCGHRFYQFSPELFFRVLGANGFDSIHMYLVTAIRPTKWLKCVDPSRAGRRYQFYGGEPLQLIAIARKAKRLQLSRSRAITQRAHGTKLRKAERAEGGHTSLGGRLPGLWRRSMVKSVSPGKGCLVQHSTKKVAQHVALTGSTLEVPPMIWQAEQLRRSRQCLEW